MVSEVAVVGYTEALPPPEIGVCSVRARVK
jgi:hypothetical protein